MDLAGAIEERWADYMRLDREGAVYSACVRLGEIANCLRFAQLSPELVSKWSDVLKHVAIPPVTIQCISDEVARTVQRLNRMLGGGSSVTYEEMLLIITIRVELEMLLAFLAERGFGGLPDVVS